MSYGDAMSARVRSEERRAEIVRAALEVIAERGYRGASLAAVAERVGLTQQGLLHYFPTKDALLVAVLEERDQWDADADPAAGGWICWPRSSSTTRCGPASSRPSRRCSARA